MSDVQLEQNAEKLARSDEAQARLDAIEHDKFLVKEGTNLRAELEKEAETDRLWAEIHPILQQATAILDGAKQRTKPNRTEIIETVAALERLHKTQVEVIAPIIQAHNLVKAAAARRVRINELLGAKTHDLFDGPFTRDDGDFDAMWRQVGGRDPDLDTFPAMASIPELIWRFFQMARKYSSNTGRFS